MYKSWALTFTKKYFMYHDISANIDFEDTLFELCSFSWDHEKLTGFDSSQFKLNFK